MKSILSQGDGTRKGNGSCKCKNGYEGTNCEHCANNYFVKLKNNTFTCEECHKSCKDSCTALGPKGILHKLYYRIPFLFKLIN